MHLFGRNSPCAQQSPHEFSQQLLLGSEACATPLHDKPPATHAGGLRPRKTSQLVSWKRYGPWPRTGSAARAYTRRNGNRSKNMAWIFRKLALSHDGDEHFAQLYRSHFAERGTQLHLP